MELNTNFISLVKDKKTPILVINLNSIKKKLRYIRNTIPAEVFYAMKANDDIAILKVLHDENCGFEIASEAELKKVLSIGVTSNKIICMHSIKSPAFIEAMVQNNISIMAYDSMDEVDKLSAYKSKIRPVLRLIVSNSGSDWPLTKKFGVNKSQALDLLLYAKKQGLNTYGLTFHVGSQCRQKQNWFEALEVCKEVILQAKSYNIDIKYISLGGGLPIYQTQEIPSYEDIGQEIAKFVKNHFKDSPIYLSIEPGRGLIGDSGIMVTSVIGKALRDKENWIYLDVGVFNGLMEAIEGYKYSVLSTSKGLSKRFMVAGPSCDSVDIIFENLSLPDIDVGDKLYIMNSAAYTLSYAASFNGFDIPTIVYI